VLVEVEELLPVLVDGVVVELPLFPPEDGDDDEPELSGVRNTSDTQNVPSLLTAVPTPICVYPLSRIAARCGALFIMTWCADRQSPAYATFSPMRDHPLTSDARLGL
jgi:hypothetical protein